MANSHESIEQNEGNKPALLDPRAFPFEKATYAGGGGAT